MQLRKVCNHPDLFEGTSATTTSTSPSPHSAFTFSSYLSLKENYQKKKNKQPNSSFISYVTTPFLFLAVISSLALSAFRCSGRPIVSPFHTEGLVFHSSSSVFNLLEKSPLESLNFDYLLPNFCDMERNGVSGWECQRSG